MSHPITPTVIPLPPAPPPTPRQRKRAERARHRAAGRVAVTVHVAPEHRAAVRALESLLAVGGALADRARRVLAILEDKLPHKARARARLRPVTPAQAREAMARVLDLARHRRKEAA